MEVCHIRRMSSKLKVRIGPPERDREVIGCCLRGTNQCGSHVGVQGYSRPSAERVELIS